jgi:hypothetical protein
LEASLSYLEKDDGTDVRKDYDACEGEEEVGDLEVAVEL